MKTDLLEAFLHGELDPVQAAEVRSVLERDESLRAVYFQQRRMDAALKVLLGGRAEVGRSEFAEGVLARLRMEGAGCSSEQRANRDFSRSVLSEILEDKENQEKVISMRRALWPDFLTSAACAAVAAFAVMLGFREIIIKPSSRQVAQPVASVGGGRSGVFFGRVESSSQAVWAEAEGDANAVREDGWISNGYTNLKSGVIEIALNSGARVFLEGPAKLSVESGNRVFLKEGRMTAEVTPRSAGFTVNTPQMNVVDLGTRFGVSVTESGETEVHVMEGLVEASRAQGNSAMVELREGLALKADNRPLSSLSPIPYAGDQFTLTVKKEGSSRWQDPLALIRYTFDESSGADIFDSGSGRGGPHDIDLLKRGSHVDFDDRPRRAPGKSGMCLMFGPGQQVSTRIDSAVRLSDPFTLCFWMKIPPQVRRTVDDYMVGWGPSAGGWELGCKRAGHNGALAVRMGSSEAVGSTDLGDGNWHHIAVRFIGGQTVDLASHLHLYVDGHHEPFLGSREEVSVAGPVGELRIGDLEGSGFPGWVDEVEIFDEAISTQAIQKMSGK